MEKYDELLEKTAISVPIVCGIAAVCKGFLLLGVLLMSFGIDRLYGAIKRRDTKKQNNNYGRK